MTEITQKLDNTPFVNRYEIEGGEVRVFIDARTSRPEQDAFSESLSEMGADLQGRNTHDWNWGNSGGEDEYLLCFEK